MIYSNGSGRANAFALSGLFSVWSEQAYYLSIFFFLSFAAGACMNESCLLHVDGVRVLDTLL
jgi:hypothetical protein